MMNFRDSNVYAVRVLSQSDRDLLLDTVQQCGIPEYERFQKLVPTPAATNLYAIDLRHSKIEYTGEPHICAAMVSSGVRIHTAREFRHLWDEGFPAGSRTPIFHVPHDGNEFPDDLAESVCVPWNTFQRYHEIMRDTGVWNMVPREYRTAAQAVSFPISRLLCDVERFIGPCEIMEQYGMGFCYENAYDGTKIKNVTPELLAKTMEYYRAHHARMDRICNRQNQILLIDLHSFSDEIIPAPFWEKERATPDVCIGADERYTPERLIKNTVKRFEAAGFRVAINYPYTGCFIPNSVLTGENASDCAAVMLEFNKRAYCDSDGRPVQEITNTIRETIDGLVAESITI